MCGLIVQKEIINVDSVYINKLEKEIENIKLIEDTPYKISGVYGKVLYQNPYTFNEQLVIAANTDFLEKYNYVINNDGLIGIVDYVYKNKILVKMITSKDILLQVKINDCYGLLNGSNKVTNISNYCNINLGDKVYTSNLGYMDEEILIGTIKKIEHDGNLISDTYIIEYAVDFNNLSYVVILSGGTL
ncbi:MAG: rod shape-determining protein MreC [Bacilli bacterium]|nr:rod shape-determining protein MreC [Bacilli bacterium]